MRFVEHGPSIPDELLIARDEGRVVLFCGSGVSVARANLPDFLGLSQIVMDSLGIPKDHKAAVLFREAIKLSKSIDFPGIISADRFFSQLEVDFPEDVIAKEVTKAIKPNEDADISAHKILMDLAKTPEGRLRLVTTNFDRLFDRCYSSTQIWQYPKFPTPLSHTDFDGIVYLHGCAKPDYSEPESDFYILSSARFGQAYLTHGWVSDFFKQILDKYVVVFIGYSADDPPVRYLLEGFNRDSNSVHDIFAFQSGNSEDIAAIWADRGVKGIGYSAKHNHDALWDTLKAWSERANNRVAWYQSVVSMALGGPRSLKPYERGQVAHLVSTQDGARFFCQDEIPPAEWLCVFDPQRRYAEPEREDYTEGDRPIFDPFSAYSLDSDIVPPPPAFEGGGSKRKVPENAWCAFDFTAKDASGIDENRYPHFLGATSDMVPTLSRRMRYLGSWLATVAIQPAALWWAAHQPGLHPEIQHKIKRNISSNEHNAGKDIVRYWSYLFETWEYDKLKIDIELIDLGSSIKRKGWNSHICRKYIDLAKPSLKIAISPVKNPKPPALNKDIYISDLLSLEILYPDLPELIIPDEWLAQIVHGLRNNLELLIQLKNDISKEPYLRIISLLPESEGEAAPLERTLGLNGYLWRYVKLFETLVHYDADKAKAELSSWPGHASDLFDALRIWACNLEDFLSDKKVGDIIINIDLNTFWDYHRQRDLLPCLAKRWSYLPKNVIRKIERRLLDGPPKPELMESLKFVEWRAWQILTCVTWLSDNGVKFNFELQTEQDKLRKYAPDWQQEDAKGAVISLGSRSGWVKTDIEHSELLTIPVDKILSKATELSGMNFDEFVEHDPFSGLACDNPDRALSALTLEAKNRTYPKEYWRKFLSQDCRKDDDARFSEEILHQIIGFPVVNLMEIIHTVTSWMLQCSKKLLEEYSGQFWKLFERVIRIIYSNPDSAKSSLVRMGSQIDWATESINSPAGDLAKAMFKDPALAGLGKNAGLPKSWIARAKRLLNLPGDSGCHALVILSYRLNYIYYVDNNWCRNQLISILDSNNQNQIDSFWSGFFWGANELSPALGTTIYPYLFGLIKKESEPYKYQTEVIGGLLLAGWATLDIDKGQRLISNEELRSILYYANTNLLSAIVRQVRSWVKPKEEGETNWADNLNELFNEVWPKTLKARNQRVTSSLVRLLLTNGEVFSKAFDAIFPLLGTITEMDTNLHRLEEHGDNLLSDFPRKIVSILHRILPKDVTRWPYGVDKILDSLAEHYAEARDDLNYLEIRRKWDSR